MNAGMYLSLSGVRPAPGPAPFPWPPARQPAYILPDGDYGDRALPYEPPVGPDIEYARFDGWGTEIPDLPFVSQGSSEHPERALTGFLNRWTDDWRGRILDRQVELGLTHVMLWLADMLYGPSAVNLSGLARVCEQIRSRNQWIILWLGSKLYPQLIPRDGGVTEWRRALDPIFDVLLEADLLHHAVIGGEYDLWNKGEPTSTEPFDIADYVTSRCGPYGCRTYFHFSTEKTFWGGVPNIVPDRFAWTSRMCDLGVRGIHYQGGSDWPFSECQGRIADSIGKLDPRWHVIAAELDASIKFTQDHPTMAESAIRAYLYNCCTVSSGAHVRGYGQLAYRPDGRVL